MAKRKKKQKAARGESHADDVPFEQVIGELEAIVGKLENGETPLDDSLELYERGVRAYRQCREILERAEKRIQLLVKDLDGNLTLRDADELAAVTSGGDETNSSDNPDMPKTSPDTEAGA